jgi:hypothetical protein
VQDHVSFELFIGSDNRTHKVERAKLLQVLDANHEGYTVVPSTGYYKGEREESVVVTIADDEQAVLSTIGKLKQALKQDSIAYRQAPVMRFI